MTTQLIKDDKSMLFIALIGGAALASLSTFVNGTFGIIDHFAWLLLSASFTTAVLTQRFNEDSFTITIPTGLHPEEYYKSCVDSLLQILKMQDMEYSDAAKYNFYLARPAPANGRC
jgi:hypothetical protein